MIEHHTRDQRIPALRLRAHGDKNHPIGMEDCASSVIVPVSIIRTAGASREGVAEDLLGHDTDRCAAEEESLGPDTGHHAAKEDLVIEGEPFHLEEEMLLVCVARACGLQADWVVSARTNLL